MSRLDSAIRRLSAQRACLDHAAARIRNVPGIVVELGLGNGRTYDHLRTLLPGRGIFVFDRIVAAHPACIPDPAHLVLGDFRETLPEAAARWPRGAALVHADIGTGDAAASMALAAALAPPIVRLLAPAGLLVADQPFPADGLRAVAVPEDVSPGRYYLYTVDRQPDPPHAA